MWQLDRAYRAAEQAVSFCRRERRPAVLHLECRRLLGHAGSDVDKVEVVERGYFVLRTRDGRDEVRPLPKLSIGILPVLPGVFGTRHEVMAAAKHAAQRAIAQPGSASYVDENAAKSRSDSKAPL
jgi:hypothetical protein